MIIIITTMSWKYEIRTLSEIYRLIEQGNSHPDYDTLKLIAKKAYKVAQLFEEKGMNEELIIKYLNNQLPCDALCEFGLITSVLYPSDVPIIDRIHSYSHNQWLNSLNRTKLKWTWKRTNETDIDLEETQEVKIKNLLDNYNELQKLALSYDIE